MRLLQKSVKQWTKGVNLCEKDYVIIPINEGAPGAHWFLAIICFPGLSGPVTFDEMVPVQFYGKEKAEATIGRHNRLQMPDGIIIDKAVSEDEDKANDAFAQPIKQ